MSDFMDNSFTRTRGFLVSICSIVRTNICGCIIDPLGPDADRSRARSKGVEFANDALTMVKEQIAMFNGMARS